MTASDQGNVSRSSNGHSLAGTGQSPCEMIQFLFFASSKTWEGGREHLGLCMDRVPLGPVLDMPGEQRNIPLLQQTLGFLGLICYYCQIQDYFDTHMTFPQNLTEHKPSPNSGYTIQFQMDSTLFFLALSAFPFRFASGSTGQRDCHQLGRTGFAFPALCDLTNSNCWANFKPGGAAI